MNEKTKDVKHPIDWRKADDLSTKTKSLIFVGLSALILITYLMSCPEKVKADDSVETTPSVIVVSVEANDSELTEEISPIACPKTCLQAADDMLDGVTSLFDKWWMAEESEHTEVASDIEPDTNDDELITDNGIDTLGNSQENPG